MDKVNILLVTGKALDDSGGINQLDGNQYIQVRIADGTWTNCILLVDNALVVAANTKEAGPVIIGNIDVKAIVTGNGTYEFRWASALADGDGITFYDIQVIIRKDYHY